MNENNLAVSIIMPVYNSEAYLQNCIDSILSQEFDSFELLLIDDGSTDRSPEICDDYASQDERVKVFHKDNGGICAARNFGLENAKGTYIAFSDHDDIVLPGFLADNYIAAMENDADVVKFGRKGLLIRGKKVISTDVRSFNDSILRHKDIVECFLKMRIQGTMNCVWDGMFRRDFLEKNCIRFDTRFKKGGEDIDFCSRCFVAAEVAILRPQVYYEHYIRVGISTSTVEDPNRMYKYELLTENLECCIKTANIDIEKYRAEYTVCIAKESIYPSVKYMITTGKGLHDVHEWLLARSNNRPIPVVSLNELKEVSRKWSLFSWMYLKRLYTGVVMFVRANLILKRIKGEKG